MTTQTAQDFFGFLESLFSNGWDDALKTLPASKETYKVIDGYHIPREFQGSKKDWLGLPPRERMRLRFKAEGMEDKFRLLSNLPPEELNKLSRVLNDRVRTSASPGAYGSVSFERNPYRIISSLFDGDRLTTLGVSSTITKGTEEGYNETNLHENAHTIHGRADPSLSVPSDVVNELIQMLEVVAPHHIAAVKSHYPKSKWNAEYFARAITVLREKPQLLSQMPRFKAFLQSTLEKGGTDEFIKISKALGIAPDTLVQLAGLVVPPSSAQPGELQRTRTAMDNMPSTGVLSMVPTTHSRDNVGILGNSSNNVFRRS